MRNNERDTPFPNYSNRTVNEDLDDLREGDLSNDETEDEDDILEELAANVLLGFIHNADGSINEIFVGFTLNEVEERPDDAQETDHEIINLDEFFTNFIENLPKTIEGDLGLVTNLEPVHTSSVDTLSIASD
jgi:hypothetical protein